MIFEKTPIGGAWIIRLDKLGDERGFFARAWCMEEFRRHGITATLSQANLSYSKTVGTIRGMHYQREPNSETKAVRCIRGRLFDVVLDLRRDSPTYKSWFGVELSSENRLMLIAPEGCAHGFQTLEDHTEVFYLVSAAYAVRSEAGVRWNDPAFGITWPRAMTEISDKDRHWEDYI